ncbi:MAG: hypothetical protein ABWY78_03625 [Microvirga sp.]
MRSHRYAVGEVVLYIEKRAGQRGMWKTPYTILSYVRSDALEPRYRIASARRPDAVFVGEHELCRTPQPQQAYHDHDTPFHDFMPDAVIANLNDPLGQGSRDLPWQTLPLAGGGTV